MLIPSALLLNHLASDPGSRAFRIAALAELGFGGLNWVLLALNFRDGLAMRRAHQRPPAPAMVDNEA